MKKALRIAGYAASWLVAMAGAGATLELWKSLSGATPPPILSGSLVALGFLFLGASGIVLIHRQYRGGPYTVFGAFFVLLGLYLVARTFESLGTSSLRDASLQFLGGIVETIGGVLLAMAGAERNRRLSESVDELTDA